MFLNRNRRKVIITRGLPASGKTTWSRQWVHDHPEYKRINRDDLRMMIYEGAWNQKKEEAVLASRRAMIWAMLDNGWYIVLDDTNLDPKRLEETKKIITDWEENVFPDVLPKVKITIKDFTHVPLETCIARNAQRTGIAKVPERFIRMYYNKYIRNKS